MQNGGEVASIRDLVVELSMTVSYLGLSVWQEK